MSEKLQPIDAAGLRLAIVVSRFNTPVTEPLLEGAIDFLDAHHSSADQRLVVRVPGAWELPLATQQLLKQGNWDAVIALGALIRGETSHFDYLAQQVARGLGQLSLEFGVPVVFGVLTTENAEQAFARCGGDKGNKGAEAAETAIEMALLYRGLSGQAS